MKKENKKPVENTIGKVGSSLVWTAKVRGSRAVDRGSGCYVKLSIKFENCSRINHQIQHPV